MLAGLAVATAIASGALAETPPSIHPPAPTPLYGEIDIPSLANGERADVYVEGITGGLQWAFASATNNATHQVALVTPDGRGGRP